ncbi:MAG: dipeptide/oligopeptide/nickel ABC transporter permease/ATP-binding protein [Alphaproteobacteria bacterium]|nr:dipeptide/oligopeptide/nickel ABC transporter permease/ATP-binding protein [Alphaproteobacteria bacterium]MBU1563226.1 dipeptide/oligopeptide/nickel ABC transporter permease/ATP-binding protein [Alphaproteobacteria bacterium]MBU2303947.1 dipeptide/oligopeptide/nickel ABC transporter permease/ATP-binding protein [Alphaproteobacteria bacterium]MBU2368345.1 dipeptide/oligopeptide/nickel ABC transporter permease/ATP-binding protein [Alphaproteobacteria bacterium]
MTPSVTTQPSPNRRRSNWQLLMANRLAAAGLFIFGFILLVAILAPVLPMPDPNMTDQPNRLLPPLSQGHLLGTDHLGRDILSRLVWGTQISLIVGISATALAALFGSLIGLVAGYARGVTDSVLMRFVDMLMAFPYILLAIAIVAALGPGLLNALYAIALVNIPFFARNIRGVTVSIRNREFVDAARLSGKSHASILFTEVLPNVLPVIVITMSTTVGWMILETAGLSFLGLGAQPPTADLGSMLGQARAQLFTAPHASIIPGIMIFALVMSINLLGDGIRDVLDPRLRSGALDRPLSVTHIARQTTPAATLADAPVLVVDHLFTGFANGGAVTPAVRDVSFRLGKGECLGIIGESGSGKSVTALSLMGLVASPPGVITSGAVYIGGQDVLSLREHELIALRGARVAYVFQDPLTTLHPLFPVATQIAEAVMAHNQVSKRAAHQRALELMETVGIRDAADRASAYPHELSGGQRQRIGIAMALANDPDVIIADEPTTALDVTVQARILELLQDLRRERGLALLLITHDFGVVAQVCDRVAVMKNGEIVEQGETASILRAPQHDYTKRLIACVPELGEGHAFLDRVRPLFEETRL